MNIQDPAFQNKVYKVACDYGYAVVIARSPERAKEILTQELFEVAGDATEIELNKEQVILTEI